MKLNSNYVTTLLPNTNSVVLFITRKIKAGENLLTGLHK